MNLRKSLNAHLTLLGGLRWLELEDAFQVAGDTPYSPFASSVRGHNHLYGFQVGGDFRPLDPQRPFQIDVLGKAGIYGNAAGMNNDYADLRNVSASAVAGQCAFVGELAVTASYRFTAHLAAQGGIELLWIDGVALAPRQTATTDFATGTAAVDASGSLFCDGASVGLELTW